MAKEMISAQDANKAYRKDIIRRYLGDDRETLRNKIKEVKSEGDFDISKSSFISQVIGPEAFGMADEYFSVCSSEIRKAYYEMYPKERETLESVSKKSIKEKGIMKQQDLFPPDQLN